MLINKLFSADFSKFMPTTLDFKAHQPQKAIKNIVQKNKIKV